MFTPQQTRILIGLTLTLSCVWSGIIALVGLQIYNIISVPVIAEVIATPQPHLALVAEVAGTPTSLFPPTWTPTNTLEPTSTSTRVPTASPWPTWTPTATLPPTPTGQPPTLPTLSAANKAEALEKYKPIFQKVAEEYDLDWRLMAEQAYRESRFNPNAVGRDNDIGMMQIIPATWGSISRKIDVDNPYDPEDNIRAAGYFLHQLRQSCQAYGDDTDECMILAYNWGLGNVKRLYANGKTWRQAPYYQYFYVLNIIRSSKSY